MFVDYAKIYVRSGNGGKGAISFRREKYVPKGGPDGGNGGRGGDVILRGNPNLATLLDFRYEKRYLAESGFPGEGSNRTGKSGKPTVIEVPCGTVVRDENTGEVVADITEPFVEVLIARGGIGGRGNAEFTTSTNQAPRYADPGRPGEELFLELELKLIADVGLIGFPNAGKSTLISVLSAARPKIADYPFTTLVPNLGMVSMGMAKSFCIADIPGLIEGASEGKGLGIQFLRHVERCFVHVYMLDPTSELDIQTQYETLQSELEAFDAELLDRPRLLCITKSDCWTDEQREVVEEYIAQSEIPVYTISAVSSIGLEELKWAMWNTLLEHKETDVAPDNQE